MSAIDLYFNLVGLAAGGYCLYTWFRLKKEGKLFASQLLVPGDAKPEDCVDEEGYLRTIRPCLLFAGLVWLLSGIVGMADSGLHFFTEQGSYRFGLASTIACIVAVAVYFIVWLRARKLYWVL